MRIAVFLDQSFPPDSRVENEAYQLIKAGHEVHMYSLNFRGLKPSRELVNGIKVYRQKTHFLLYKLSALAYDISFFHQSLKKGIKKFLDEVDPQAIHIHDMLLARPVMDVNDECQQLPVTLDLHENRPEIMKFYPHLQKQPGKSLISIKRWKNAQNQLIRRAQKIVMVTPEAVEVAVNETGDPADKFISLPNTVEKELYLNYPIDMQVVQKYKKGFDILYLGDTGLRRGLETAIRALKILLEKVPHAQLVIVGKSTEDVHLESLIEDLGIGANVYLEGWKDVTLFPSYVEGSEVCISPLKRNLHHDTTLANKVFQYMAGGKPILASDCPAQVSIIEECNCGLIHEAENEIDMAAQLLELYKNPTRAHQLGANGREAVLNKYNWETTAQPLVSHYDFLSSGSGKHHQ